MSWATFHIQALKEGKTVSFRPRGNSMEPKIKSGQLCEVEPIKDYSKLSVGDIVLCKVKGNQYLHLVTAVDSQGRFQISNNKGFVNGWISSNAVFGRLIKVSP